MLHDELDFYQMGEKLLERAKEHEISARGRISELFPYIYQAAKRMSTRAISEFLAVNFGVKLSAVGISRALRDEEKHWEGLAEIMEPSAVIVARAHGISAYWVLDGAEDLKSLENESPTVCGEDGYLEYKAAVEFLKRRWFSLDKEIRDSCMRFVVDDRLDKPETDGEHDQLSPQANGKGK
jgi:hypothetical protein